MNGSLETFYSKDNAELHGFLVEPEKKTGKCLVHIHGMAGNFYENNFIKEIAENCKKNGWAFFSFNNRGSSYLRDVLFKKKQKIFFKRIGSIHESFKEFTIDAKAAISFLKGKKYKEFIIQGHSLGCHKALLTALELEHKESISGIVLLSPWETIGLQKKALKKKFGKTVKIAEKLVVQGKGRELMPKWSFIYPLSAKTFLEYFGQKTKMKLFEFTDKNWNATELNKTNKPVLITCGSRQESTVNPKKAVEIVSKKTKKVTAKIINNATHSYRGYEKQLAKTIGEWINKKNS